MKLPRLRYFSIVIFFQLLMIPWLQAAENSLDSLTPKFQKMLDDAVANSSATPGAVLLISSPTLGTSIVAAGEADIEKHTLMKTDNNFRVASITKTYLAITVLKLVEKGKINLDDKIADLLPKTIEIKRVPNGDKATVRQLLHMSSGIPNYTDYEAYGDFVKAYPHHQWTPEQAVELIYDEDPEFAPGQSYEYCNTNFVLLQLIVENVTQKKMADVFQQYIFDPLQLKDTYAEIAQTREGGFQGLITHGYELNDDKELQDVTDTNDSLGLGDGAIVTTAQDLAKLVKALLYDKTLLTHESLVQMEKLNDSGDYGLGIYTENTDWGSAWTHNGASAGFEAQYYYFPEKKATLIILTNSFDSDIIDDVQEETLHIIDGSKDTTSKTDPENTSETWVQQ